MTHPHRIPALILGACLGLAPALAQDLPPAGGGHPAPGWTGQEHERPGRAGDAAVDPARFDPEQARNLKGILQNLQRPAYGWFYGPDAALGSWAIRVRDGMAPPAYRVHRALGPSHWHLTENPEDMEVLDTYLYTGRLGAWLSEAMGVDAPANAPAVIITPKVEVVSGRAENPVLAKPAVTAFARAVAARSGSLTVYLPLDTANPFGASRHYLLAVARLKPAGDAARPGRDYSLDLQYFDPLMSGRTANFSLDDQDRFSQALARTLGQWLGGAAIVASGPGGPGPDRNARLHGAYHQVRSQMPGTMHCGRYVTLYLFADLMGIPYGEWYQERFNKVLPAFIDTFEPHLN